MLRIEFPKGNYLPAGIEASSAGARRHDARSPGNAVRAARVALRGLTAFAVVAGGVAASGLAHADDAPADATGLTGPVPVAFGADEVRFDARARALKESPGTCTSTSRPFT